MGDRIAKIALVVAVCIVSSICCVVVDVATGYEAVDPTFARRCHDIVRMAHGALLLALVAWSLEW